MNVYKILKYKFYETILHYACKSGNYELVKYLISHDKIDISCVNILYLILWNYTIIFMIFEFYKLIIF